MQYIPVTEKERKEILQNQVFSSVCVNNNIFVADKQKILRVEIFLFLKMVFRLH